MLRVSVNHPMASELIAREISELVNPTLPIVVICIGTDRSTGDSLGPLVGTFLQMADQSIPIYGTLSKPVHAQILEEVLVKVYQKHRYSQVIAIDACLGSLRSVGDIIVEASPLKPGSGVDKILPQVGDISIRGVVNIGNLPLSHLVLANTRLSLVWRLASVITNGIVTMFEDYDYTSERRKEVLEMLACSSD